MAHKSLSIFLIKRILCYRLCSPGKHAHSLAFMTVPWQPDWTHTAIKADKADTDRPKPSAAGNYHSLLPATTSDPGGKMLLKSTNGGDGTSSSCIGAIQTFKRCMHNNIRSVIESTSSRAAAECRRTLKPGHCVSLETHWRNNRCVNTPSVQPVLPVWPL